ncbi:aminotransferase class IV [Actinocorallia sp. API 0066]|uniref:aminotransferase class IV n=1 Tax=Actinocorallia sp. API 0066 TaxID=2896846 RepID=UPI001E30417A|nr:aminotransferase class IV [Actinocorallia sp. API 0066]MCD0448848.1 aminotransferase class IV [Actinocorallia sp. API 0066]
MLVWTDGVLGRDTVSVVDHGITVGDGVFETIKLVRGVPFALTRHLRRLAFSARGLGLPEPDEGFLRKGIEEILAQADPGVAAPDEVGVAKRPPSGRIEHDPWELGRLRITYTGGPGPLGSVRGEEGPTTIVIAGEQKPFAPTSRIATVPWPRNERGPLAGLKTTSYADNVIALAKAAEAGADEAVFGNLAGNLCEGTGSNIFVVVDGRALTPTLESGCLAGVTRALALEWTDAVEADVPYELLGTVQEAFLTSTTRDIQPITWIDGRELPVGDVTRAIAAEFTIRSAENVDP